MMTFGLKHTILTFFHSRCSPNFQNKANLPSRCWYQGC